MSFTVIDAPKDGNIYFKKNKSIVEKRIRGNIEKLEDAETKSHKPIKRAKINGYWFSVFSLGDQKQVMLAFTDSRGVTAISRTWKEKRIKNLKRIKLLPKRRGLDEPNKVKN